MRLKRTCFAVAICVMLIACSAFSDDFEAILERANKGDALAQSHLGYMYNVGQGVKQDYKKALEWYLKADKLGHNGVQKHLGYIYEHGLSVKADYNEAVKWYRKGAEMRDNEAKKALELLGLSLSSKGTILAGGTGNKPRIAVLDFEDRSEERKANPEAIMNMMVSELHKSGVFTLLERERLNDISKEINLGQSGLVDTSTAVKIGKLKGAQYVMTGAITLYQYSEKASGFVVAILGAETKAKTAYVVLDIRIVNVETGEIVYAYDKTGQATQRNKNVNVIVKDYDKMVGGLLDTATRDAVKKHVSAINVQTW